MRRAPASLLAFLFTLCLHTQAAVAKARLIAVFPLRSTTELTPAAKQATQLVVNHLGAVEGFDAKLIPAPPTGSLGAAAAAVGAEFYVVGQLLKAESGYEIILGSFQTATDKSIANIQIMTATPTSLPAQSSVVSLIPTVHFATSASDGASGSVDGVEVTAGLPLDIHLDAPLSSSSAKVGDMFSFQAASDVVSGGWIVVPKGSQGQGEVVSVESAGSNGHPGKLGLQFDWIVSADGSKVKLSISPRSSEGEGKGGAASTATIASYLVLGPLGLFAHNFVKGKDITVEPTSALKAYVEHTVHVKATQKAEPGTEFAH